MAKRRPPAIQLLPPEQVEEIRATMRRLHDLLPICESCEQCGICMDEHKTAITALNEQFTALLKHFGPGS